MKGLLLFLALGISASAADPTFETQANVMVEFPFIAMANYADPFHEATLEVTFTDPAGKDTRVPAFWAGKNVWKVRYASPTPGTHAFRSHSSNAADAGLHGIAGTVVVKPYTGANPLYAHGPLRVGATRRALEHLDGTPFLWLGDTWWMGLCHRLHFPDEFQALAADRKAKGFNVIQIVAGLYPDMPPFDPRGANEAGFPWEPDYTRIRPEYFDAADRRLAHLVESGFTPCIVGAWGYFIQFMGVEKAKQHWRYLVARYGAWPVVWCVAGEANLPYYRAPNFPSDDRAQVKGWTEVTRYLRDVDPFHRPITIHPTGIGRLSARNAVDDVALLDVDLLQTPHGEREAVAPTIRTVRTSYADTPVLPVIDGEPCYEMLNGKIPAEWPRRAFWSCMLNGAAGHTYGANGIWQVNRKNQPHGPSPTVGSPPTGYGTIPWDEAMHLPGSAHVALGKKLLEEYPWWKFEPHPEWASFADKSVLSFTGADWIWFPEGKPAQDAPTERRYFRKRFTLPENKPIQSARLRVTADDQFSAWLNERELGGAADWKTGKQFEDVGPALRAGTNVLAIEAANLPANVPANPAGLIACLEIQFANGETSKVLSDETWLCANAPAADWTTPAGNKSTWRPAAIAAHYGDNPWGRMDALEDDIYGPQSAGIPNAVRIIYVPQATPVVVRHLPAEVTYTAAYFDPVTGTKTPIEKAKANADGTWKCPPPPAMTHDWLLVLVPAKKDQPN